MRIRKNSCQQHRSGSQNLGQIGQEDILWWEKDKSLKLVLNLRNGGKAKEASRA